MNPSAPTRADSNSAISKTMAGFNLWAAAFTIKSACWRIMDSLKSFGGCIHSTRAVISITICLFFILFSGCATQQSAPEKVYIQVPVSCIKESPILPVIATDAELAAMSDHPFVIELATARIALRQYAKEAAAVISACQ